MAETTEGTTTRAEKSIREFYNAAGEKSARAGLETTGVVLRLAGVDDFSLDIPYDSLTPEVARAAALFGVVTTVTNTIGKKGMTTDEMIEALEARAETLMNGIWTAERASGPRTSDVLTALIRYRESKGAAVTDEWKADMAKRLAEDTDFAADVRSRPAVAVLVETIKLERQQDRIAKAKAKAGEATPTDDADLLA